ncbi:hypothetical protein, conserved in T. vivax [Trypanosoma vivax Y486]|uniref:Uncharacterized protein n=1 Tax=Trypanosoma vivax (strain Y486) TaxID=1055687 RepID=F9WMG8_TRYVY|nr:hypothetical protein, conserved in T. vivax [Trypanosoma vivax Y486]|eukprot:CCD18725.1 hypothetical protein, conserved in T. vivax [Trypanosoma vivax Y486]
MAKGGTNTAAQWQGLRVQRCESGSIHRAEAVCREEKRIVGEKWETAAFVKAPQRAVRNANGAPPCRGRLSTGKVNRDAERHSATLRSTAGLSEGEHGLRKQMPKRRSNYTSPASSRAGFDTLQLNKAPRAKQETNKTWSHQMKRRRPWRTGQPECVARFGASQMNPQRGKRAAQCKTRQITTQMCKRGPPAWRRELPHSVPMQAAVPCSRLSQRTSSSGKRLRRGERPTRWRACEEAE